MIPAFSLSLASLVRDPLVDTLTMSRSINQFTTQRSLYWLIHPQGVIMHPVCNPRRNAVEVARKSPHSFEDDANPMQGRRPPDSIKVGETIARRGELGIRSSRGTSYRNDERGTHCCSPSNDCWIGVLGWRCDPVGAARLIPSEERKVYTGARHVL